MLNVILISLPYIPLPMEFHEALFPFTFCPLYYTPLNTLFTTFFIHPTSTRASPTYETLFNISLLGLMLTL